MKLPTREQRRRPSASMAGLDAEERARIGKMTSIERMTLALRMAGCSARSRRRRP